jgi:CubicO group peptidase (beta-lactamase class C family)
MKSRVVQSLGSRSVGRCPADRHTDRLAALLKALSITAILIVTQSVGLAQQGTSNRINNPRQKVSLLPARIVDEARQRVDAKWYPSLVVAFVDGANSEIATFGRLEDSATPDGRTVYEIGSITKTFTAALLADAINSGRLTRDTAVATLLPAFPIPTRNGKYITVADLATQTSGLPYMPDNLTPADSSNPFADYDAEKLKNFLAAYALQRDPGDAYEYSNLGFGLLGFSLTQPQSFGELVRARILEPLGMTMTDVGLNDAMRAHLARGHNRRNQQAENWKFGVLAGCGGIDSTAGDMLSYLKANMNGEGETLSRAFRLAQQPERDVNSTERIGLAWMTRVAKPYDVIWHNGTTFGYASFIGFTANRKRGIVILTNISESVDDLGFAALSDAPLQSYKVIPLSVDSLNAYTGVYKVASGGLIKVFVRHDQIYAQALGEDGIPLFPRLIDKFFTRIDGFQLMFRRNEKGQVSTLVLRQKDDRIAIKLKGDEAAAALSKF